MEVIFMMALILLYYSVKEYEMPQQTEGFFHGLVISPNYNNSVMRVSSTYSW
jgi:hypothetical protein